MPLIPSHIKPTIGASKINTNNDKPSLLRVRNRGGRESAGGTGFELDEQAFTSISHLFIKECFNGSNKLLSQLKYSPLAVYMLLVTKNTGL